MRHQLLATAVCPHRKSTTDRLAEAGDVWFDTVDFLRAAVRGSEARNHFIENQQTTIIAGDPSQSL